MNAANLIKEIRTRTGLNRTAFGRKAGLTYMTIYNWENGVHDPSLRAFLEMLEAHDFEFVIKPKYKGGYTK